MKEMHARPVEVLAPSLKREVPRTYHNAGRMSNALICLLGMTAIGVAGLGYRALEKDEPKPYQPDPTVYVEETRYSDGSLGYGFHIKNPTPDKFYLKVFVDRFSGAITWYHDGMLLK